MNESVMLILDKIGANLNEGLRAVKLAKRALDGQLLSIDGMFDRLFDATLEKADSGYICQADLMRHVCAEIETNESIKTLADDLYDLGWTSKPQNALYIRFLGYLKKRLRYVKSAYPRFYGVAAIHLSSSEEYEQRTKNTRSLDVIDNDSL